MDHLEGPLGPGSKQDYFLFSSELELTASSLVCAQMKERDLFTSYSASLEEIKLRKTQDSIADRKQLIILSLLSINTALLFIYI